MLSLYPCLGEAIRNIRAIDTLQLTFQQARSACLCNALLERVREIFERSPGNYFILDKHHLVSSITEIIASKPNAVQVIPAFSSLLSIYDHLSKHIIFARFFLLGNLLRRLCYADREVVLCSSTGDKQCCPPAAELQVSRTRNPLPGHLFVYF